MYLREFFDFLKPDRKVCVVTKSRIMFYYSLQDYLNCDIPCVKNNLSCKVKDIAINEFGELYVYLFAYGEVL